MSDQNSNTPPRDLFKEALKKIDEERGISPEVNDPDIYKRARAKVFRDLGKEPPEDKPTSDGFNPLQGVANALEPASELWRSVGGGIAKAGFETKDFLMGEPEEADKSQLRRDIEQRDAELRAASPVNALASSISQFATGMIGAGKIMAPIKGVQKLKTAGKAGRFAYETARGAIAGGVVIDPHEERLSNLIESFPSLQNPVTEYLAANPEDSAAEGRLKNALEGIGLDFALAGVFAASTKALKLLRQGQPEEAAKVLDQVETAQKVEAPSPKADGLTPSTVDDQKPAIPEQSARSASQTAAKAEPAAIPTPAETPLTGQSGVKQGISPEAAPSDVQFREIIESTRRDLEALDTFGSREEAIANGHKFASYNLPWQKLNGTDEAQTLVANTAKTLEADMAAKKGGEVLKDAEVSRMVSRAADLWGEDPALLMGELSQAGDQAASMVANMEASYLVSRRLFDDAYAAATKVQAGMLDDFGGSPAVAREEVRKRLMAAADMLSAGSSMRAAAGRALRRNRSEFAIKPEDVAALSEVPADKLIDAIVGTRGEIDKLKQVATPSFWRRMTDEATFLLTNNLLWNYPTHIVNTTGNLMMLAFRPTEKVIGSFVLGSKGGAIRSQALREYRYTVAAIGDAWEGLVSAFVKGDSILSPHTDEHFMHGSRVNAPPIKWKEVKDNFDHFYNGLLAANFKQVSEASKKAAVGAYRTGVGLPTRALGATDEFIKVLRYRAVVQAKAAGEAADAGLTGSEFTAHVKRRMGEALTVDGKALDAEALQEAKITTHQQELLAGTVGHAVQTFRHQVPAVALVLPYIKTPVNVLRYSWKMTPVLNLAQTEYQQMLKGAMGPEAQAQAVGQMALGATFMTMAATLAAEGRLTGGGPKDPALRTQLLATGWKPYSIVTTKEDGSKSYFPLGRFDPVGLPFGLMADLVDMRYLHPTAKETDKAELAIASALFKSFSDRSFLQNTDRAIRAFTDPERNLERFMGSLAGAMVPGSSGLKAYANSDTYLREARGVVDIAMRDLPGYSETLPPRRDSFGEPIWRQRGLTSIQGLDVVEVEHVRIITETGEGIRPPAPSRNGVDLRDVTLSDGRNAFDLFQERTAQGGGGKKTLKAALEKLITSKGYAKLVDGHANVDGTKLAAMGDIVRRYRELAYKSMLRDYPELRKEVMRRQTDVRDAIKAKRASEGPTAKDLQQKLKDMGY
jgi:hypothetical protein